MSAANVVQSPPISAVMPASWQESIKTAYAQETFQRATELHFLFVVAINDLACAQNMLRTGINLVTATSSEHFVAIEPRCFDEDEETALHVACRHAADPMVDLLLDAAQKQRSLAQFINANKGWRTMPSGVRYRGCMQTPLHLAAMNPRISATGIQHLLSAGADPLALSRRDNNAITFLMFGGISDTTFLKVHLLFRQVTAKTMTTECEVKEEAVEHRQPVASIKQKDANLKKSVGADPAAVSSPTPVVEELSTSAMQLNVLRKKEIRAILTAVEILNPVAGIVADYYSRVYCPTYSDPNKWDCDGTAPAVDLLFRMKYDASFRERMKSTAFTEKQWKELVYLFLESGAVLRVEDQARLNALTATSSHLGKRKADQQLSRK